MKKNFLFLTAAMLVACAVSCKKTAEASFQAPEAEKTKGRITVNIGIPEEKTKALANSDNVKDFRINSVQLFVFDNQGGGADGSEPMETDYYYAPASPASNSVNVTMNTTSGRKIIYAVVNRARMTCDPDVGFTTGDFEELLVDLQENSFTGLVMAGKNEIDVEPFDRNANPDQTAQEMDLCVRRLVAMVKLSAVTVDFSQTSLAGSGFKITGLYLKNAVGRARMGLDGNTADTGTDGSVSFLPLSSAQYANGNYWYNKMKMVSGCPVVLTDSNFNVPCTTAGTATAIGRCLFTFPNATDTDSTSSTWSARRTRLIVKASVTGEDSSVDTYYTFTLPPLESNKVYNIQNIHITQMGKADDNTDTVLSGGQITPTVTVDDWDSEVINLSYEF